MDKKSIGGTQVKHLLLGLVAMTLGNSAFAAESYEEIIVIGTQLEETIPLDLREYGNRVKIITADEIELAGFNDVSQTLQMKVPGLYLAPKNGAFDYVNCSFQGSRCQDVLWLIDGVRINNRLYNTTAPFDTVPAHMIERIEVLYGGQGIFYGTQSVAGVVNIVTKSFSDEPRGSVSIGFDQNDATHVNGDYSRAFGDHRVVVYASKDEADGFKPYSSQEYQPSGTDHDRGYDVLTLGIKYGYSFSPDSNLTLHYHRTDNEVEYAAPSNRARSFNEREEDLFTAKWDYRVSENVDLFVKGYYHKWDSHWTRIDNELDDMGQLTGNFDVRSDKEFWGYEDYGVTAMTSIATDFGLDFEAGYDHQRFSGKDDVLLIAQETEHVNAVFVQVRTNESLMENTRLAFGVRYNRPSGEGDITVWNLSGQHDFSDQFYARATMGTSFRFPDAWQLYGNDPCCTLGNPDLEGEQSTNFNVAIGGRISDDVPITWELIGFRREVEDLIGSANGMRINSDADVEFDGWEVTLGWDITPALKASLDYTSTEAEASGSSEQITDIPESLFKATLTYLPEAQPFELDMSVVNVGD
ncbi:MAG: TonB-dependent receptor, partial [Gammaproteobacteria bacterium]|nr:TonB-dependent receptor [Gammaproteobacteria bacterium]